MNQRFLFIWKKRAFLPPLTLLPMSSTVKPTTKSSPTMASPLSPSTAALVLTSAPKSLTMSSTLIAMIVQSIRTPRMSSSSAPSITMSSNLPQAATPAASPSAFTTTILAPAYYSLASNVIKTTSSLALATSAVSMPTTAILSTTTEAATMPNRSASVTSKLLTVASITTNPPVALITTGTPAKATTGMAVSKASLTTISPTVMLAVTTKAMATASAIRTTPAVASSTTSTSQSATVPASISKSSLVSQSTAMTATGSTTTVTVTGGSTSWLTVVSAIPLTSLVTSLRTSAVWPAKETALTSLSSPASKATSPILPTSLITRTSTPSPKSAVTTAFMSNATALISTSSLIGTTSLQTVTSTSAVIIPKKSSTTSQSPSASTTTPMVVTAAVVSPPTTLGGTTGYMATPVVIATLLQTSVNTSLPSPAGLDFVPTAPAETYSGTSTVSPTVPFNSVSPRTTSTAYSIAGSKVTTADKVTVSTAQPHLSSMPAGVVSAQSSSTAFTPTAALAATSPSYSTLPISTTVALLSVTISSNMPMAMVSMTSVVFTKTTVSAIMPSATVTMSLRTASTGTPIPWNSMSASASGLSMPTATLHTSASLLSSAASATTSIQRLNAIPAIVTTISTATESDLQSTVNISKLATSVTPHTLISTMPLVTNTTMPVSTSAISSSKLNVSTLKANPTALLTTTSASTKTNTEIDATISPKATSAITAKASSLAPMSRAAVGTIPTVPLAGFEVKTASEIATPTHKTFPMTALAYSSNSTASTFPASAFLPASTTAADLTQALAFSSQTSPTFVTDLNITARSSTFSTTFYPGVITSQPTMLPAIVTTKHATIMSKTTTSTEARFNLATSVAKVSTITHVPHSAPMLLLSTGISISKAEQRSTLSSDMLDEKTMATLLAGSTSTNRTSVVPTLSSVTTIAAISPPSTQTQPVDTSLTVTGTEQFSSIILSMPASKVSLPEPNASAMPKVETGTPVKLIALEDPAFTRNAKTEPPAIVPAVILLPQTRTHFPQQKIPNKPSRGTVSVSALMTIAERAASAQSTSPLRALPTGLGSLGEPLTLVFSADTTAADFTGAESVTLVERTKSATKLRAATPEIIRNPAKQISMVAPISTMFAFNSNSKSFRLASSKESALASTPLVPNKISLPANNADSSKAFVSGTSLDNMSSQSSTKDPSNRFVPNVSQSTATDVRNSSSDPQQQNISKRTTTVEDSHASILPKITASHRETHLDNTKATSNLYCDNCTSAFPGPDSPTRKQIVGTAAILQSLTSNDSEKVTQTVQSQHTTKAASANSTNSYSDPQNNKSVSLQTSAALSERNATDSYYGVAYCVLGEWNGWSDCSYDEAAASVCQRGSRERARAILKEAHAPGRKPCVETPGFAQNVTCQLRNMSCDSLSPEKRTAIRIMHDLGCMVLISLLAATLGIFILLRKRWRYFRRIYWCYFITTEQTMSLQFFTLANFGFLCLESFNTYALLTGLAASKYYGSLVVTVQVLAGWGIAGIVAALQGYLQFHDYAAEFSCWVNLGSPVAFGVGLPSAALAWLGVILCEASSMDSGKSAGLIASAVLVRRRAAVFISQQWYFPIVSVNWIAWLFGAFTVYFRDVRLYGILMAMHICLGILIMLAHISANERVLVYLINLIRKCKSGRSN